MRATAVVSWERNGQAFTDGRYSRRHELRFDGGATVRGSSSPEIVPLPMSDAAGVDPEEAFVASLSACHMLWFLSIAAGRGFLVDRYDDVAEGLLAKTPEGRLAITVVTLRPCARFSGAPLPGPADIVAMHDAAHEACFLANSVRAEVRCEPR